MLKQILLLVSLCFLFSCKEDPGPLVTLSEDDRNLVQYQTDNDFIVFHIASYIDTTNELSNEMMTDLVVIHVDYALNEELDFNEDFELSNLEDGRLCKSTKIDSMTSTTCEFSDDWTVTSTFAPSANSTIAHINHEIRVKKSVLSDTNEANVIIHVFDQDDQATTAYYFPQFEIDFSSALKLSW